MYACILIPRELSLVLTLHPNPMHVLEMSAIVWSNSHLSPGTVFYPDEGEVRLDKIETRMVIPDEDVSRHLPITVICNGEFYKLLTFISLSFIVNMYIFLPLLLIAMKVLISLSLSPPPPTFSYLIFDFFLYIVLFFSPSTYSSSIYFPTQ